MSKVLVWWKLFPLQEQGYQEPELHQSNKPSRDPFETASYKCKTGHPTPRRSYLISRSRLEGRKLDMKKGKKVKASSMSGSIHADIKSRQLKRRRQIPASGSHFLDLIS
ncbi:hypothetical protein MGYG_02670 [Nannizzia gypsea CBS 118893]|uniref:Uncharacterized protein n=1 Tax=Arthroderma gypseum (strain ATCC MYA-4604 / CBS 118893) TaxID=535722 RepID=E4UNQ4_ARTGP|nr:hypothetical protein MGYG_02670 [Nannizzia gypsea CBS 118893]EFQ99657.1 hypothetical protein MGYG_02670 [Nannizzia gypsea CBS 118893]